MKGSMNEITRKIVIQTARKYHREAERNGEEFLIKLQKAHNDLVANEMVIPLWFRIQSLWKSFHPDHFDNEGFLAKEVIEELLSKRVSNIVDRICNRPGSKYFLSDYGDFPCQVANPVIPHDIEKYYQTELDWCIVCMAENPNLGQEKLARHLEIIFKPIPPMATKRISTYAVSIRTQDQTVGLPLFQAVSW